MGFKTDGVSSASPSVSVMSWPSATKSTLRGEVRRQEYVLQARAQGAGAAVV
jgi:hypothetical protein